MYDFINKTSRNGARWPIIQPRSLEAFSPEHVDNADHGDVLDGICHIDRVALFFQFDNMEYVPFI